MAEMIRVGPGHILACKKPECPFQRAEGSEFCPAHPSNNFHSNAGLRQYVLQNKLGQRAGVFANNSDRKNLTEELALIRAVLELVLTKINCENDAILYIDRVDKSVNTISKLVSDMQKIEVANKELLDRATVFAIGDEILTILVDVVPQEKLMEITEKIYEAITTRIGG